MKYENEALEVIHQDAKAMHKAGAITDARMREYDEMCLSNTNTKQESTPVYENSLNIRQLSHATS